MANRNRKILRLDDVVRMLRVEVGRVGGQAEWARRAGVSRPNLNSTITGKRPPTKDVLRALKLRKVFAYELDVRARDPSR